MARFSAILQKKKYNFLIVAQIVNNQVSLLNKSARTTKILDRMSLNGKKTNLRQTVIPRPREQPFGSSSGGTLFTKPQQDRDTLPSSSNNNASLLKTVSF